MAQTRRAKMHLRCVFILLVLSVVAESCDEEYYEKDNKCCSKCGPGTKMMQNSPCDNPDCQECADGQYQDSYTSDSKCMPQPYCNPDLNLQDNPQKSKTKRSPCVCIPDHHCSSTECNTCVKNTICKAGERVIKISTQMSDTVCEPCPNGTFSDHMSASTCKPWTECPSGYQQVFAGTATSDKTCEQQSHRHIAAYVVPVVFVVLLAAVGGYFLYKKSKTGSVSFMQKAWKLWETKNTQQPAQDDVEVVVQQPEQPVNQPQEDTEDLLKHEDSLIPGISENGMPVIQDHSKSSLLSKTETEPESFSDRL